MMKKAFIFPFLLSLAAHTSEGPLPDFEAELRALETNQLRTEELQMRNADAVTGVLDDNTMVSDEVSSGLAGTLKEPLKKATPELEVQAQNPLKPRRIRSR